MVAELDVSSMDDGLNAAQREAVNCLDGPLLVVAGAGSGKTRVITRRVARLVDVGIAPESILAVTFTNKAAREMRERVDELVGPSPTTVSTFHSFGSRFLRGQAHRLGYDPTFSLFDRSDSESAVKAALDECKLDHSGWAPRAVMETIGTWKSRLVTPSEAKEEADSNWEHEAANVYAVYEALLERNNAFDFDDLLYRTVRALTEDDELRTALNDRFQYVLVDEYQDVNEVQYRLVRLLGDAHRNVCVTGDPDQCIYAWRGAQVHYILDFENEFEGAKVVRLEQNYRSVNTILRAASHVIRFNQQHGNKELWSDLGEGDPIRIHRVADEVEEARQIVERIRKLRRDGVPLSDIAVFYRLNSLSLPIERSLMGAGLPYQVLHGLEFFKRKEVKDLLAYLRALVNPDDEVSLGRVINAPTRGIGSKTRETLVEEARRRGRTLGRCFLEGMEWDMLTKRARGAVDEFAALLGELRPQKPTETRASDVLKNVVERTDYTAFHTKQSKVAGFDPLGNIHQLIEFAGDYDREDDGRGVQGFLEDVSLYSDVDSFDADVEKVVLMTLHSAKGLEFPHAFIVGLEQDIFPHRGMNRAADVDEERRLFYVGVTRAMQSLTLLTADVRMRFGQRLMQQPSLFLSELPEDCIDVVDDVSGYDRGVDSSGIEYEMDEGMTVRTGARVVHPQFGGGVVTRVRGRGLDARVEVDFDDVGRKMLVLRYAGLTAEDF